MNNSRKEKTPEDHDRNVEVSQKVLNACLPHTDSFLIVGYLRDSGEKYVLSMRPAGYDSALFGSFCEPVTQWLNQWGPKSEKTQSEASNAEQT
ncbi:MAG: hypothetical protein HN763_12985 [Opitutales bacterium]|jgi:hypothetical protein|nr:hypothetical protein [Opitutales bacterium]